MSLLEQIYNAGVVGAGGAGFPTHKKLAGGLELLLINAAECEPLLCSDRFAMREFPNEIIEALLAVREEFSIPRVVIGTKGKYAQEISALKNSIEKKAAQSKIEIFETASFYPAGDEQSLIFEVTGKTVPPGGIPPMLNIAVINVTTALNIRRAMSGEAVTRRYVTVNGAVKNPVIVDAPIGTSVMDIIAAAGGALCESFTVIKGGPMMGAQFSMDDAKSLRIGKADGGILVLPDGHPLIEFSKKPLKHMLNHAKSVCIQCSYCTELCPRNLIGHKLRPNRVMRSVATGTCESDLTDALLCSECGLCELFSCPMQLSPRKINVYVKGLLREKGIRISDNNVYAEQTKTREYRRVAQSRIISRLGLDAYPTHIDAVTVIEPNEVRIALKHGAGRPGAPVVQIGDTVEKGALIGSTEFADVGANVHASISGTVVALDEHGVTIKNEGGGIR